MRSFLVSPFIIYLSVSNIHFTRLMAHFKNVLFSEKEILTIWLSSNSSIITSTFQVISNSNQKQCPNPQEFPPLIAVTMTPLGLPSLSNSATGSGQQFSPLICLTRGFSFIYTQWIVTLRLTTKLRYDWLNAKLDLYNRFFCH